MKIVELNIPADESMGLKHLKAKKLKDIVILTGKNGGGKTRVLNRIENIYKEMPLSEIVEEYRRDMTTIEQNIVRLKKRHEYLKEKEPAKLINEEKGLLNNIKNLNRRLEVVNWSKMVLEPSKEKKNNIVRYVPYIGSIDDPLTSVKNNMLLAYENAQKYLEQSGMAGITKNYLNFVQHIQERYWNASHQNFSDQEKKESSIKEYEEFSNIVEKLLGERLERNLDGNATLFGFPISRAQLSNGQKILLQFCVALFSQGSSLDEFVLLMDEPENHLHPSALIDVIERIKRVNTKGQIWIATHSVPLIAHFEDRASVLFVEDGGIEYAGKKPETILENLIGGPDNVSKLQNFLSLPAEMATSKYAYECLFEPGAVDTGPEDIQSNQVRDALQGLMKDKPLKMLDFGAGKGRILSNLFEVDASVKGKLDYIAYDPCTNNSEECKAKIERVYETSENRYFNDLNVLRSKHDDSSFYAILMCNVLHEIDPSDWISLFKEDGKITKLLSDNGVLILIEDHLIPKGEKAHQKGFIVLDAPQLKTMFSMSSDDIICDEEKNGRLKAHLINKEFLKNITSEKRKEAINDLNQLALEKIDEVRGKDPNYKNGQEHGYWLAQFANTSIFLSK